MCKNYCPTHVHLHECSLLLSYVHGVCNVSGLKNRAATVCLRCDRLRNSGQFTCGRCGDIYWTKPMVGVASEPTDTPTPHPKKRKMGPGLEPNWNDVPSEPGTYRDQSDTAVEELC